MSELHLIVLWSNARAQEERILADVRKRLAIVRDAVVEWPADAVECFKMFYGVKLDSAADKAEAAGAGPFRMLLVRDDAPRYAVRETSRGLEKANETLFDCKQRYRQWTVGGHSVHTTNSEAETRHDIVLLTGHTLDEWKKSPNLSIDPFPGVGGWRDLRTMFAFLNETLPYVVLRNWESLPDAFDPELHGDIDMLVPDAVDTATLLGARLVYDEPNRVHYAMQVGGREQRFDFRYVGDGYYTEAWERRILSARRLTPAGFYVPSAEDAFYSLVYHALYQKPCVAEDYPAKCRTLADEIGLKGDFDDYLVALERYLAANDYRVTHPRDDSVYFNEPLISWRDAASRISARCPIENLRPFGLAAMPSPDERMTEYLFDGRWQGREVIVKYAKDAAPTLADEYRIGRKVYANFPQICPEPLFWHDAGDDRYFVQEKIAGVSLDRFIAETKEIGLMEKAATDLVAAIRGLESLKILHRDLRPANILVQADGSIRLIDFQFSIDLSEGSRESYYLRCHADILMALGADYRASPSEFCDVVSLARCLELFPKTPTLDALRREVAQWASSDTALRLVAHRETWRQRRRRRRRQRYEKYGVENFWGYVKAKIRRRFA